MQLSTLPIIISDFLYLYSVFHRFRQATFVIYGSILSSSQFLLLPQLPQKNEVSFKSGQNWLKIIDSQRSNSVKLTACFYHNFLNETNQSDCTATHFDASNPLHDRTKMIGYQQLVFKNQSRHFSIIRSVNYKQHVRKRQGWKRSCFSITTPTKKKLIFYHLLTNWLIVINVIWKLVYK